MFYICNFCRKNQEDDDLEKCYVVNYNSLYNHNDSYNFDAPQLHEINTSEINWNQIKDKIIDTYKTPNHIHRRDRTEMEPSHSTSKFDDEHLNQSIERTILQIEKLQKTFFKNNIDLHIDNSDLVTQIHDIKKENEDVDIETCDG